MDTHFPSIDEKRQLQRNKVAFGRFAPLFAFPILLLLISENVLVDIEYAQLLLLIAICVWISYLALKSVEYTKCPRCNAQMSVPLFKGNCRVCGLQFHNIA